MGRSTGSVAIMLMFEPASPKRRPISLVRVDDPGLARLAAQYDIAEAEARASDMEKVDELPGELERAEVERLRRVFALLLPDSATSEHLAVAVQ